MHPMRVSSSQLSDLQYKTSHIRNICIIAHIDHGKTTLADNLISSNGIISQKMAGKLRFLDSTDDEQKRGITMYSSAISLLYSMEPLANILTMKSNVESKKEKDEYLINLVDSPGHIDFSSDVSTATRLCDGALLVVDVLEGICPQTHAVLYKALKDRMHPCLVLNKIDKLVLELNLSPMEAFNHMRRIIERVNALASTLLNSELRALEDAEGISATSDDKEDPLIETWNFAPEKGNVVFASAIDGWGFGIGRFALFWAKQLSVNKSIIQKHMFDDFAFNKVSKKIVKVDPTNPNSKPMFVTMVLEPIWQMYDVAIGQQNGEKAAKMAARLGVEIAKRDVYTGGSSKSNQVGAASISSASNEAYRGTLQAIMRAWLPLADAVLRTVVRVVPDPAVSQRLKCDDYFTPFPRVDDGWNEDNVVGEEVQIFRKAVIESSKRVSDGVTSCRLTNEDGEQNDDGTVVFIAKMIPVRIADLSPRDADTAIRRVMGAREDGKNNDNDTSNFYHDTTENINNTEIFLALGRVFSGTLTSKSSDCLYCLSNHHNPFECEDSINKNKSTNENTSGQRVPLSDLSFYMCLGPSVLPVETVPAGNIVCIFGLQDYVLKSATLCSTPLCMPMKAITFQTKPMLRVAVEPKFHYNLRNLEAGLQQLYQYDPVVEIGVDDLGQSTITCLGELHLELCLKALSEKFAKCEVVASAPLVPFRESVVSAPAQRSFKFDEASVIPAGLEFTLPPPWKDLSGIHGVKRILASGGTVGGVESPLSCGAMHRLVMTSQRVAVTFRCFSLPSAVTNFLTPEEEGAMSSNAHLLSQYISTTKSDSSTAAEVNYDSEGGKKNMNSVWDGFLKAITLCGADEVDHYLWNEIHDTTDACTDNHVLGDSLLKRLIALGPHGAGPNMLLFSPEMSIDLYEDEVPPENVNVNSPKSSSDDLSTQLKGDTRYRYDEFGITSTEQESSVPDTSKLMTVIPIDLTDEELISPQKILFEHVWTRLRGSVVAGFQMLTASGPLMQEPLQGVCFSIDKIEISARASGLDEEQMQYISSDSTINANCDSRNEVEIPVSKSSVTFSSGQLISDVKDSLRLCMLGCALRLVEPIYKCSLQCDQVQLGNLYAVLSRRRGEVADEDVIEGTSLFILTVRLPVANSFGFAQELLRKTSGSGTAPQLLFSHWSVNELDPFWKPTTSDEQEEFGTDGAVDHNLSRSFIDGVRKRKGLVVEEKMVVSAEKQRTLTRNK